MKHVQPRVRLCRHTRTHLTTCKSHPTSQWLPLPCLWPLSSPPSSARTSPPSRAPASPRSRPRRWPAAAPPSRYEHRRCARPHRPRRRTPASRRSRERARVHARLSIESRARRTTSSSRRPRARAATPDRATRRKREPSHRSRVQRVACGEDMPPDRRAREPRRARDSVGAHRDAREQRRGVRRARLTPVPARATRRTSALRERSARIHRLFIHSLPFGERAGTRTRPGRTLVS